MLKFKHIHILEQLLLESELIIIGNEISDIITFAKNNGQKEEDIMKKVDEFLSRLIENDILNKAENVLHERKAEVPWAAEIDGS